MARSQVSTPPQRVTRTAWLGANGRFGPTFNRIDDPASLRPNPVPRGISVLSSMVECAGNASLVSGVDTVKYPGWVAAGGLHHLRPGTAGRGVGLAHLAVAVVERVIDLGVSMS